MIQPLLVPLCFVTAWGLVVVMTAIVWKTLHRGIAHTQRLHQIPCTNCRFFTGDYHLKCTIHPCIALSETAINCRDYEELL